MAERSKVTRCAIYTRKSSEEGLEQAFNSLHAQREACEAYAKSQKHEGWSVLPTIYDDGGFSGGSMERPALQRLLQDVRDRKADVVVVYKIDRLTRSLFDFAKIVETFDAASVSFVSVTQSFNTTTSMGRLTLNVLLSFAQFEREVTGERIRDKIAASKRKGMFMGGNVPLGYDLVDHQLVVNSEEALTVRTVFDLFLRDGSVRLVKRELDRLGLTTKRRIKVRGNGDQPTLMTGAQPFGKGHIYYMLRNPVYIGKTRHRTTVHPGRHEPIIPSEIWNAVQAMLASNMVERRMQTASSPSLLVGKLFDANGNRLTPTYATKGARRYRYYSRVGPDHPSVRVSAGDLEQAVIQTVASWLGDFGNLALLVEDPAELIAAHEKAQRMAMALVNRGENGEGTIRSLLRKVVYAADRLIVTVDRTTLSNALGPSAKGDTDTITIEQACTLARRGKAQRLIVGSTSSEPPSPDATLATAILRAQSWFQKLKTRQVASIADLASAQGHTRAWISQQLPLAFLAPDIVETIAAGRQPSSWTVERLVAAAISSPDWAVQRTVLS
jgi:DNA invertase Pin-like site-specific DNA recombinase